MEILCAASSLQSADGYIPKKFKTNCNLSLMETNAFELFVRMECKFKHAVCYLAHKTTFVDKEPDCHLVVTKWSVGHAYSFFSAAAAGA